MYRYEELKPKIFTEEGQRTFLEIRDRAHSLLSFGRAARLDDIIAGSTGDSWLMLACVDRLVELGELVQVSDGGGLTQHRHCEIGGSNRYQYAKDDTWRFVSEGPA